MYYFVSYPGVSLAGGSYFSAEKQSVYFTAQTDKFALQFTVLL